MVLIAGPRALEGKLNKHRVFAATDRCLPIALVEGVELPSEPRLKTADAQSEMTGEQQQMVSFDAWVGQYMAARLRQRIADGACLFLIMVHSPDEERSVAQVLLRYASGQVQVHDIPH